MLSLEMSHMKLCTKYKAALDYKPRILGPKIEKFPGLVHKLSVILTSLQYKPQGKVR